MCLQLRSAIKNGHLALGASAHKKHRVRERGCSRRVVPKMIDTTEKVGEVQAEAAGLGRRSRSTRRREIKSEIAALVFQQSLAEWRSFPEDMCGGDEAVEENLHFKFTFERLHSLRLRVRRLLKL